MVRLCTVGIDATALSRIPALKADEVRDYSSSAAPSDCLSPA